MCPFPSPANLPALSLLQLSLKRGQDCTQAFTSPQTLTGAQSPPCPVQSHWLMISLAVQIVFLGVVFFPPLISPHFLSSLFFFLCVCVFVGFCCCCCFFKFPEFELFLLRKPKSPSVGGQARRLLLTPENPTKDAVPGVGMPVLATPGDSPAVRAAAALGFPSERHPLSG